MRTILASLLALGLFAGSANAAAIIESIDFTESQLASAGTDYGTVGYWFTVGDSDIEISHLGYLGAGTYGARTMTDNLNPVEVGIWRSSDQTLLGSVTVDVSGTQDSLGFIYEALSSPVTLLANTQYALGAHVGAGQWLWATSDDATPSVTLNSAVASWDDNHGQTGSVGSTNDALLYPAAMVGVDGRSGTFGPNARIVPEPASLILLLGVGGLLLIRRRRKA